MDFAGYNATLGRYWGHRGMMQTIVQNPIPAERGLEASGPNDVLCCLGTDGQLEGFKGLQTQKDT